MKALHLSLVNHTTKNNTYSNETVCCLCNQEFDRINKMLFKVRNLERNQYQSIGILFHLFSVCLLYFKI